MLTPLVLAELTAVFMGILALPYLLYFAYIRGKVHVSAPQRHSEDRAVKVSILICTLNAAETIEKKITEILHQNYPLKNIELIVIDGGSTDGTVEILENVNKAISQEITFKVISGRTFAGKASQINEGFRASSNAFVITTDADCAIDSDAIRILVDSLSQNGVGAVCSRQVLTNPDQNLITGTEVTYRHFYETLRIGESNLHSTPIYHGGLSGYHKESYSPIAEDVNADDTQLALAAIRKGFRALYEPRCVYYTKSPSGPLDGLRQRIRRGQGLQRVFWRNRDMMLCRKYGAFGFPICPAEFFMHLISPLLFVLTSVLLVTLIGSLIVPVLGFAFPVGVLGLLLLYWKRNWAPVVFLTSFTIYQLALSCAMVLHLMGYNYRRWSRTGQLGSSL